MWDTHVLSVANGGEALQLNWRLSKSVNRLLHSSLVQPYLAGDWDASHRRYDEKSENRVCQRASNEKEAENGGQEVIRESKIHAVISGP